MSDLTDVLRRIQSAANDTILDAPAWSSEPRDVTGHPGHAKLREAWGVPVGGRRLDGIPPRRSDDVNTNLLRQTAVVNEARRLAREEKAREAWQMIQDGASVNAASAAVGLHHKTLKRHWRLLELAATVAGGDE